MSSHQYKAPSDDFGLLSVPALTDWQTLAQKNHDLPELGHHQLGQRKVADLRRLARHDFLKCAMSWNGLCPIPDASFNPESLWFMTGHQPELYHPGVWAKNFAVSAVAQSCGGFGFNLVADTDQFKSNKVRIPSGSLRNLEIQSLTIDAVTDGRPYEAWQISDKASFRDFGDRVQAVLCKEIEEPLVQDLWSKINFQGLTSGSQMLSLARQQIEHEWGFGLTEAPMSMWAETEAVLHIFCMILADLPRFHAIHETELRNYRSVHKIHSRNHPVADLESRNDWWEAPLWIWRDATPLREKLWVRICNSGSGVELRIDGEKDSIGCLAIRPDKPTTDGVEQLKRFSENGICIRPRALVTTALCRTLLADLFIHGIGGAIYDELGDQIFCRFFGMTPPEYAVMSATLRLQDFSPPVASQKLDEQRAFRRRILWKGETLPITNNKELATNLIQTKKHLLDLPTQERQTRRMRARQLRKVNHEISLCHTEQLREVEKQIEDLRQQADLESTTRSREYSIAVHSSIRLRKIAEKIRIRSNNPIPS